MSKEVLPVAEVKDILQLSKTLIKELNKDAKEKVAWCLSTEVDNPTDVKDFISTGSTLLNYIITNKRNGGVPAGKLTEICGEEASGKSLLANHILANAQKKGGLAVLIDTENAFNTEFAKRIGLNIEQLVYIQPQTVEEVFENIEKVIALARAKDVKRIIAIVWDSVAGTPCKAEIEGDYDPNSRIGLTAKAIAKGMRKLTQTVGKEKITLVFTNQLKVKIGVMFGDPMQTPGGKAIPYHASVRIRLNRSTELKDDAKATYAIKTNAKVIKGRFGPPLRKCSFNIHFSDGIDDINSWRDYLWEIEEIKKSGGFMHMKSYDGTEIKFRESAWESLLASDPKMIEHVLNMLEKHLVVNYDARDIQDLDMDSESLMDVEAVQDIATNS
jgi:recombination protein RecA